MTTHGGSGLGLGADANLSPGTFHHQQFRETFHAAVAAGEVKPLVIPWSFLGSFYLPLLYLSIPHTNRPWLYRLRWAVAAAVLYLNARLMQTTSAGNEAVAYSTGLIASWGTFNSLRLLLFTRPQWDAARVERRPRRTTTKSDLKSAIAAAPDESVAAALPHDEYFWQPFPSSAPFLTRLGWTADLLTSFRGAGWNHAIRAIPHPPFHPSDTTVPLHKTPLTSRTGFARSPTYTAFLRSRLTHIALSWLTLDLLTITLRYDPYFLLGPDYHHHPSFSSLPVFFPSLPWRQVTLPLLRNLSALAGVIAGLHFYAGVLALAVVFVPPLPALLGPRADLWQHPTLFGGFTVNVLDRGLAGLWGGWWHQTFRAGFVAPARWLVACFSSSSSSRHGHGHDHGSGGGGGGGGVWLGVLQAVLAFLQSGLLHAAGGYTSPRRTTVAWTPVAFFMLQAVGVLLQSGVCALLRPYLHDRVPKGWRRVGNLLFVALWLHLTGWGLIDDFGRAGLWLFEPVPMSPLRAMGFGPPGESWWRWDGEYGLRWYTGRHWWESGVKL